MIAIEAKKKNKKIIARVKYGNTNYDTGIDCPVFENHIVGLQPIDLEDLLEKGFSCETCKFYGKEWVCFCKPHRMILAKQSSERHEFLPEDFQISEEDAHCVDQRGICEFHRFAPVFKEPFSIPCWYDTEGDQDFWHELPIKFAQFAEEMKDEIETEREFYEKLNQKLKLVSDELENAKGFLKFIKNEFPAETYRLLRKNYKERGQKND